MIVNAHGGSGSPDYGEHPASLSMWLVETAWFSHRPLWTFILAGVFDRFPALRLVLAEQGSAWIRDALDVMDNFYAPDRAGQRRRDALRRTRSCSSACRASTGTTNCMVAASFLHREDCARRDRIGVDHIMWGADYPTSRARRRSPTRPSA